MVELIDLANFATVAIAINLAYINLDIYRYLRRMTDYLSNRLEDISPQRIRGIFRLIDDIAAHNVIDHDMAKEAQFHYAFLDLFGKISEYRRRDPRTGMKIEVPPAEKHEDAKKNISKHYTDGIHELVTYHARPDAPKRQPVSPTQIFKFYKTFFLKGPNSLRTRDQIRSIVALFAAVSVLVVISFDSVLPLVPVPLGDGDPTPEMMPFIEKYNTLSVAILLFIAATTAVYVFYWLYTQYKIRRFFEENARFFSTHTNVIFLGPVVVAALGFLYIFETPNPWVVWFQEWATTYRPIFFFVILTYSTIVPLQLLLTGYRMVPIVEAQIDSSIEYLSSKSADMKLIGQADLDYITHDDAKRMLSDNSERLLEEFEGLLKEKSLIDTKGQGA